MVIPAGDPAEAREDASEVEDVGESVPSEEVYIFFVDTPRT